MFIKIPFESEIEFKTNISEITKMSLEHDFNVNEGVVLGNFYVSGEYRVHEVSINKEPFKYTLPFTVELRDDLRNDTIEFNIEDFSYEIIDNKTLKVSIEYSLTAEVDEAKEELFKRVNEDELESELAYIDSFLEAENNEAKEVKEIEKIKEITEVEVKLEEEDKKEDEISIQDIEERVSLEEEKTIMETIKDSDDTFVTYHIHIIKESETKESICAMYNVPVSLISEYNNLENMTAGDKVLIPKTDE